MNLLVLSFSKNFTVIGFATIENISGDCLLASLEAREAQGS
jgi:hypothetical protein